MLRIAGIVKESVVDGPGLRYVIFTQGCLKRCIGCHNSHTQNLIGGYEITITELLESILGLKLINGITFSGGEPFLQAQDCARLAHSIKEKRKELNIIAYSGYYYNELLMMSKDDPAIKEFLCEIDFLIDGPFDKDQKSYNLPFRGSRNQKIIELAKI
ncbi:MAG: anaerobic ribonucleoside-triphosphate reductase activating protein [Coxiellaceae bacterium]|jgi:anaerobic ribonucleoside-triphosphate reductase activating protein|nr:anaerobic ribonucleoside-triphosphate reductase activating protein [Coxiellaceae bacterium]